MNGPLKLLQICAREYNWKHEDMLKMSKRILFRYYGYYLIDQIQRAEEQEKEEAKRVRDERMNNPNTEWKSL